MPGKRLSVLIGVPSFRRPGGLRKLLNSIEAQQGLGEFSINVFVADNDPQEHEAYDLVAELASGFPWPLRCEIVAEPGISAARNAILDQARDSAVDFIAMIDDDEVAEPCWLRELLACQGRFEADIVGGPVDFDFEEQPSISVRHCGVFDVPPWSEGVVPLLHAAGNLLVRTAVLANAGWPRFDPTFGLTGGEDGDFLRRMRQANARFAWAADAIAWENVPKARACREWVLQRSFHKGNINMRLEQAHGGRLGTAISLGKALVWLGSAPISAVLIAVPSRRLWIAGKWSQSIGKLAAVLGRGYNRYGGPAMGRSI